MKKDACNWTNAARRKAGEMAEWLKAHAWKACLGETLTRVRIPLSPPFESRWSGIASPIIGRRAKKHSGRELDGRTRDEMLLTGNLLRIGDGTTMARK